MIREVSISPELERINKYVVEYGIKSDILISLEGYSSGNDYWIGTHEAINFDLLKVSRRGMRAFRLFRNGYKPTINLVQLTGRQAVRTIELNRDQAERFIRGVDLDIEVGCEPGYLIVSYNGFALGVGKYREGKLKNQIPRARRVISR